MLHGTIVINGDRIGSWAAVAQREFPGQAGTSCTYKCEVRHNDKQVRIDVEHAYDDGALVLMRKMLDAAIAAM